MVEDWFGVRFFFRHALSSGGGTYEERVTLWTAPDFDAAILLAEAEAEEYSKDLDCELMRDSEMEPGAYLSAYFDTGDERQQTDQA